MNLTNKVYGRLTVLRKSHIAKNGQQMWVCRCECGKESIVQQGHLRDGHSRSCGKCNSYKSEKDITTCIVSDGREFTFHTEDLSLVKTHTWHIGGSGYVLAHDNGKLIKLHRLLLKPEKDMFVDHIDRNPLNNCRKNLRICTKHQNCFNQGIRKDNTTGFKGVRYSRNENKLIVRIGYKGKRYTIGRFPPDKLLEAAKAYNQKATELFGEYAFLNSV